ncbi:hypothetical protein [Aquimarina aquimarini]|uniref:hypothetical protein n=1 Tax=Aquimarina aquimarini TaxID=1191734 RepID=UPI001F2017F2|nr:hypothetical protein [Aquimarina aquimarini]
MIGNKKVFIPIFIVIGAIIIFIAPLLHINFPKKPEAVKLFEKKIDDFNLLEDNKLCQLKGKLEVNKITYLEYIEQRESLDIDRSARTDLLNFQLKQIVNNHRVFGFRTLRVFLIGFGIRLPYILFSFIILFFFLYSRDKLKTNIYLYRSVVILYTISFLISFYMTIWFVLPQDLPVTAYHILIATLTILSSWSSIYLVKYYYDREIVFVLSLKIKELIHFITTSRRTYVLDFAVKASQANPDLKEDIKLKLGEYDEQLEVTMKKVAGKDES